MEGTIVVSPGLPEVAPENAESLGFLSELISDSLGRLDSLKRSASTAILDLLEANVRLGWYLEDARHFLRKEGTYVAWIEQTCPLSYGHTTRLRQLAKHFCRDSRQSSASQARNFDSWTPRERGAFAPANRSIQPHRHSGTRARHCRKRQ